MTSPRRSPATLPQHYDALPKPYRRYQTGTVWRNEKPGPGRFREFTQFDADTIGSDTPATDAEFCMLAPDALERLGIARGNYRMRVNNRKILDGVLEGAGVDPFVVSQRRPAAGRACGQWTNSTGSGVSGVELLLGKGRKDDSGDFTEGAKLDARSIAVILDYITTPAAGRAETLAAIGKLVAGSEAGRAGVDELSKMSELLTAAGYAEDRVVVDPSIVRGLEYYTGPVFEAELTFEAKNDAGEVTRFGSVGGGGRYDGLVERFKGTRIPGCGFSIGVSRLYAALQSLGKFERFGTAGPVVVLVMDRERVGDYQAMTQELRAAGIAAEMYLGSSGMKAQMKYADKRGAPAVVIEGGDEKAQGVVTIKDLVEGAKLAASIEDRSQWTDARPAQVTVPRARTGRRRCARSSSGRGIEPWAHRSARIARARNISVSGCATPLPSPPLRGGRERCNAALRFQSMSRRCYPVASAELVFAVRSTPALPPPCGAGVGKGVPAVPPSAATGIVIAGVEPMTAESAKKFDLLAQQAAGLMAVFGRAGHEAIAPAILQPADVYLEAIGEDLRSRSYVFTDPDGIEMCLRPDLTVPTCRLYLERFPDAATRAKFAYNGPCFRFQPRGEDGTHPREFRQAGLESFNAIDPERAEADIVALIAEALRGAGLRGFRLRLGDLVAVPCPARRDRDAGSLAAPARPRFLATGAVPRPAGDVDRPATLHRRCRPRR